MDDSVARLELPQLTVLSHQKLRRRKRVWELSCPELGLTVSADERDEAREKLQTAVDELLNTASLQEIETRLAKGTTYFVEPLALTAIVRADDEELSWLQRGAGGAIALAGAAKDKSGDLAATVAGAAASSGRFVAGTAANAYDAVGDLASNVYARTQSAADKTAPLLIGLAENAGGTADAITNHSSLRQLAKTFNLEAWLDVGNRVDIEKAEQVVAELKRSHPTESNRQIARRLIAQKALYAGGVGLSTSLLPGAAVPLLALDMATTALLQAELVFQIAAAYGLNLQDPARKGEMLAVFGCVLGGSRAVKAGLGVLRNAPVAGAVIGATSNAAMIYALGNVACSFYEKRLDLAASAPQLEAVVTETALYLEAATDQQIIADQILMHVLRAGNPSASRDELLQALRALNFSPASVEAIENSLDSPTPLGELLPLLNAEFGDYVSNRARQIAHADGVVTAEEAEVLQIINAYFESDENRPSLD